MERHLVIQLARFGDLVQTKRLLASLAAASPGEDGPELHLCLDRSLAPLARLIYPQAILHPVTAHGTGSDRTGGLAANRDAFGRLKSLRFDRVWNLNFSGLNFALASLFDPATVRGYRTVAGQPHLDAWPALAMRWARHRRTCGLNLVDLWGAYAGTMVPPGRVNPAATPARTGGGGLGVVLAGRHSRRTLPPEVLAPLVPILLAGAARGGRITLLGSESEKPYARALMRALKPSVLDRVDDLSGRTGWAELIEVVSGLDCVLTPDTGTMHLAAHLGVPVQAMFLSSAWCFETGPYGLGHTVWQAVQPCAPCLETRPCDRGLACLSPFTTPEFLRAFGKSLAGGGQQDGERGGSACPGVVGYASGLDALGATYEPMGGDQAEDPDRAERAAFRAFIASYLGLGDALDHCSSSNSGPCAGSDAFPASATLAARMFQERDWMLGRTGDGTDTDGQAQAGPGRGCSASSDSSSNTSRSSAGRIPEDSPQDRQDRQDP